MLWARGWVYSRRSSHSHRFEYTATVMPQRSNWQGIVRRARRRGRQKEAVGRQRQRVDRTGLFRVTEGRGRQTDMVARTSVVPLLASGSRDRQIMYIESRFMQHLFCCCRCCCLYVVVPAVWSSLIEKWGGGQIIDEIVAEEEEK